MKVQPDYVDRLQFWTEDWDWYDEIAAIKPEDESTFNYIKQYLSRLNRFLQSQDAHFLGNRQSSSINLFLEHVLKIIDHSNNNQDADYLLGIVTHIENFNDTAANPVLQLNENSQTIRRLVAEIETFRRKSYDQIQTQSSQIEKNLQTLSIKAQDSIEQLDRSSEILEERSMRMQKLFSVNESNIDALSAKLDSHVESFKLDLKSLESESKENLDTALSAARSAIANDFSKFQTDAEESFRKFLARMDNDYDENVVSSSEEKLENLLHALEEKRVEASEKLGKIREIYQLVGEEGMSGGYQAVANENRINARNWRYATVFLMLVNCLAVYLIFRGAPELTITGLLFRLSIAATLGSLTTYVAFQTGRYRYQYERFNATFLQLKALPSFLSDLPADDQHEILKSVADALFVDSHLRNTEHISKDSGNLDTSALVKALYEASKQPAN